jgi:hypothetical protein
MDCVGGYGRLRVAALGNEASLGGNRPYEFADGRRTIGVSQEWH